VKEAQTFSGNQLFYLLLFSSRQARAAGTRFCLAALAWWVQTQPDVDNLDIMRAANECAPESQGLPYKKKKL
jgi:hypothetical protein